MDLESQKFISKILKFLEVTKSEENFEEFFELYEFSDLYETLRVDNAVHSLLIKQLNSSLIEGLLKNQKNNLTSSKTKPKIKYTSRVNTDQLDSVLNLSLWKNAPNTSNLFDLYEVKKNNFIVKKDFSKNGNHLNPNSNNSTSLNNNRKLLNENFDSEENPVNKKFRNNFKYNKLEDEEENVSDKFHQTNTYMSFQVNLKRKK